MPRLWQAFATILLGLSCACAPVPKQAPDPDADLKDAGLVTGASVQTEIFDEKRLEQDARGFYNTDKELAVDPKKSLLQLVFALPKEVFERNADYGYDLDLFWKTGEGARGQEHLDHQEEIRFDKKNRLVIRIPAVFLNEWLEELGDAKIALRVHLFSVDEIKVRTEAVVDLRLKPVPAASANQEAAEAEFPDEEGALEESP